MICDTCNYEFCWICRRSCDQYHFIPFNPFGCGSEKYSPYRNPCARVMLKIVYILAFIILFPLIVLIFLPATLAYYGAKAVLLCMLGFNRPDDNSYIRSDSWVYDTGRISFCSPVNTKCVFSWVIAYIVGFILFCVGMTMNIVLVPIFVVIFILVLLPMFLVSQCR